MHDVFGQVQQFQIDAMHMIMMVVMRLVDRSMAAILAPQGTPGIAQFRNLAENRFLARFDKQFVPGIRSLRARIVSHVEAQEIESFRQVNDPGLLR